MTDSGSLVQELPLPNPLGGIWQLAFLLPAAPPQLPLLAAHLSNPYGPSNPTRHHRR
jgi:hypothetical protein